MRFKVYIGNYIGSTYGGNGHRIKENFFDTDEFDKFVNIVNKKRKNRLYTTINLMMKISILIDIIFLFG